MLGSENAISATRREFFQHGFAHRVERVLDGKAVVFGESFDNRLPHVAPRRAGRRFRIFIAPIGFDRSAENPVVRLRQSRVAVFYKTRKAGFGRFQND